MQPSNKEREYRCKIIAENHLKKDGQRYLDRYVRNESLTYKTLYSNDDLLHSMIVRYNLSKLGNAMKYIGTSCVKAANALQGLAASLAASLATIQSKDNFMYEN